MECSRYLVLGASNPLICRIERTLLELLIKYWAKWVSLSSHFVWIICTFLITVFVFLLATISIVHFLIWCVISLTFFIIASLPASLRSLAIIWLAVTQVMCSKLHFIILKRLGMIDDTILEVIILIPIFFVSLHANISKRFGSQLVVLNSIYWFLYSHVIRLITFLLMLAHNRWPLNLLLLFLLQLNHVIW